MLSSQIEDIAVEVKGDLAVIGDLQFVGKLDVAREADNIAAAVGQGGGEGGLIGHRDVQAAGEGEFLGDEGSFLPLRAVLVPAIEGVAGLGGIGQGNLIAGLQNLDSVVGVVDAVGHDEAGDLVSEVLDAAVERAAGDAAIIVSINIHGIRAHSAGRAADDLHVAVDGERTGVRDAAAIQ